MPYKDPEKQREAQRKYERTKRPQTHKVWTFIFYEEDCEDWRQVLDEQAMETLVSPLHDKDVWTKRDERKNPEHKAGETKKPHRHGLRRYPHAVKYEQVIEDLSELGVHSVKFVGSYTGMALYLTHAKSPNKAWYDPDGVVEFGGASYNEAIREGVDVHAEMVAMRQFIRQNTITEFVDFQDWCDVNADDWSYLLDTKCSWAISHYIERYRNKLAFDAKEADNADGAEGQKGAGLSATPAQGGPEPRTLNPNQDEGQDG